MSILRMVLLMESCQRPDVPDSRLTCVWRLPNSIVKIQRNISSIYSTEPYQSDGAASDGALRDAVHSPYLTLPRGCIPYTRIRSPPSLHDGTISSPIECYFCRTWNAQHHPRHMGRSTRRACCWVLPFESARNMDFGLGRPHAGEALRLDQSSFDSLHQIRFLPL